MSAQHKFLWRDVTVFDGLHVLPRPMAVVTAGDYIDTLCPMSDFDETRGADAEDLGHGGVMTPGLVDCHTHLVFGGERAAEFEQRLEGASYAEIANSGGGILSTVRATRAASEQTLFDAARPRLQALIDDGVTCVEIKSGYGLTVADELKMLRVARRLGEALPVRVVTTLLGAHALPPEYKNDADGYIDLVCSEMIPAAASEDLADAVDVFCESIAFDVAQCERVFQAAQYHGLPIKAHSEQLSNLGGTTLAAHYNALSADHIEYANENDVRALADAGSVAVILPGAFHTLRETQQPPIDILRKHSVPMAVATDGNPGSSPLFQPTLMLNLACTLFRMTPREALSGMTAHGAQALQRNDLGRIQTGGTADLCIWNIGHPAELSYAVQPNRLRQRIVGGVMTHNNTAIPRPPACAHIKETGE